jgi:plasmid maintenance system antidote protein VapI
MDSQRRGVHFRKSGLTIIHELREAMADSGLTEYRIAKDSGVPQPVLNRFLRGERGISLETAAKLCTYLGLHLVRVRR